MTCRLQSLLYQSLHSIGCRFSPPKLAIHFCRWRRPKITRFWPNQTLCRETPGNCLVALLPIQFKAVARFPIAAWSRRCGDRGFDLGDAALLVLVFAPRAFLALNPLSLQADAIGDLRNRWPEAFLVRCHFSCCNRGNLCGFVRQEARYVGAVRHGGLDRPQVHVPGQREILALKRCEQQFRSALQDFDATTRKNRGKNFAFKRSRPLSSIRSSILSSSIG